MSIHQANLRRILQAFALSDRELTSFLRADVRAYLRVEESGPSRGGMDFYVPFWSDAKLHAFGEINLSEAVEGRVDVSPQRKRLYPILEDGFLSWWNTIRRTTNEPIRRADHHLGVRYTFDEVDTVVKVENILSIQLGSGDLRHVYPYFSESPPLNPNVARLGLWLLSQTLTDINADQLILLDVPRGRPFSLLEHPLQGGEQEDFVGHYQRVLARWEQLLAEYESRRP